MVFLFIASSCICSICSKDDAGNDNANNNNGNTKVEPVLKPDATGVYLNDVPSPVYFCPGNTRRQSQKWIATKIKPAISGVNSSSHYAYLVLTFENTVDTRFLSNKTNPVERNIGVICFLAGIISVTKH